MLCVIGFARQHEQLARVQEGGFVIGLNGQHDLVFGKCIRAASLIQVNAAKEEICFPQFRIG